MVAFHWHGLVARNEATTRLYLNTLALIARALPARLRGWIEWLVLGQDIPWKRLAFRPRSVVLGRHTTVRMTPHLGEFDQAALFRQRMLEDEGHLFNWLEANAGQRYDAVIDIGANVGSFSMFFDAMIRSSPQGRLRQVYAFEPSRIAYGRLLANLAANGAEAVEPFCLAISDETGFSQFFQPDGRLTNGSLSRDFANLFANPIRASLVPTLAGSALEALFARHERVLLKIDAEGIEPTIVAAMAPILRQRRPDLLIEVLAGVDEELRALDCLTGYACFQLGSNGPERRETLTANTVSRDWLLTMSPQDFEVLAP